jgi:hypothetical protein
VVAGSSGAGVASDAPVEPGEQTAVTMAGAPPAGEAGVPAGDTGADAADEGLAAESGTGDAAAGEAEPGRPGS